MYLEACPICFSFMIELAPNKWGLFYLNQLSMKRVFLIREISN
jgi:hypothetical protein